MIRFFSILFICFQLPCIAQDFKIVELSPHKDSVTFDLSKNWYMVITEEPVEVEDGKPHAYYYPFQERVIAFDLSGLEQYFQVDSAGLEDSLFYFRLIGQSSKLDGKFLIGTSDSLRETNYRASDFGHWYQNIGFSHELTFQGVRDYSPYINLNITGATELIQHQHQVTDYQLLIDCDFDSHSYYKVTSFGNGPIKDRKSFTQLLTPMIQKELKDNYGVKDYKITYSHIRHIGHLDRDSIMDFIIEIRGINFLFLSYKHSFERQTIFHLEYSWPKEYVFSF
jgi:hypothetical protein